jgi:hypothetical protein
MEPKIIRPQIKAIQKRFFRALNECIKRKKILGIKTFCSEYNLNRTKYSKLRTAIENPERDTGYRVIDLDALTYLVRDYGVSADWLLTGKGSMFK